MFDTCSIVVRQMLDSVSTKSCVTCSIEIYSIAMKHINVLLQDVTVNTI